MSTSYSIDGMTTSESEFSDSRQIQTTKGKASPNYHYDDSYASSSKTSRNSSKTGLIVGCIIGAVLLIGVIVLIIVLCTMSGASGGWESRCKPINEQCPDYLSFIEANQKYVIDLLQKPQDLMNGNLNEHKKHIEDINSGKFSPANISEACKKAVTNSKIGEMSPDQSQTFWKPVNDIKNNNNEKDFKKVREAAKCIMSVTFGSEKLLNKAKSSSNRKDTLNSVTEYVEAVGIKDEDLPKMKDIKKTEAAVKKEFSANLPKIREDLKQAKQAKNYAIVPDQVKTYIDTYEKYSEEELNKMYEDLKKNIDLNDSKDVKMVEALKRFKAWLEKEVTPDKIKEWEAEIIKMCEEIKRKFDKLIEEELSKKKKE